MISQNNSWSGESAFIHTSLYTSIYLYVSYIEFLYFAQLHGVCKARIINSMFQIIHLTVSNVYQVVWLYRPQVLYIKLYKMVLQLLKVLTIVCSLPAYIFHWPHCMTWLCFNMHNRKLSSPSQAEILKPDANSQEKIMS